MHTSIYNCKLIVLAVIFCAYYLFVHCHLNLNRFVLRRLKSDLLIIILIYFDQLFFTHISVINLFYILIVSTV